MVKLGLRADMLRVLSDEQLEQIHVATIEVLENTGVHVGSEAIFKVFADGGADVDPRGKTVKIPRHLVEESLEKKPKQIILQGRNPEQGILLEENRVYFGAGGTPVPYFRDMETGKLRTSVKRDMINATILADALSNIDFVMSIAGARDFPEEVQCIHEFEVLFKYTEKPIIYHAPGIVYAEKILKMAEAIVGDREQLRKRPIFSFYCEPVSPLTFYDAHDTMIEAARNHIPITLGIAQIMGATAPITIGGSLVVGNALNLASVVLAQLVSRGAPIIYGNFNNALEPRTAVALMAAPEKPLASACSAQLAQYYDIPSFGVAGQCDSNLPDAQFGAEVMLTSLMNALSGTNLCHDCGYLATGLAGSLEAQMICDEVVGIIARIIEGVEVNDDTLAVDVIHSVGPGGNFLSQSHTLKYVDKALYLSKLFDKTYPATWMKAGSKDVTEIAREKIKKILREYEPRLLPKDIERRLSEILKESEKELVKR